MTCGGPWHSVWALLLQMKWTASCGDLQSTLSQWVVPWLGDQGVLFEDCKDRPEKWPNFGECEQRNWFCQFSWRQNQVVEAYAMWTECCEQLCIQCSLPISLVLFCSNGRTGWPAQAVVSFQEDPSTVRIWSSENGHCANNSLPWQPPYSTSSIPNVLNHVAQAQRVLQIKWGDQVKVLKPRPKSTKILKKRNVLPNIYW